VNDTNCINHDAWQEGRPNLALYAKLGFARAVTRAS
jgi:hypothetical protein